MTDDLMAFLHARLDEAEAFARNAFGEHNEAGPDWHEQWSGALNIGDGEDLLLTNDSAVSRFIARHDPARVLREVEAKRLLLDAYDITRNSRDNVKRQVEEAGDEPSPGHVEILNSAEAQVGALDDAIRYMATVYADHPDYRAEWRP